MTKRTRTTWRGAEKRRFVIAAPALDETALGARLGRFSQTPETERIRELKRDARRTNRMLAETAALLVLKNHRAVSTIQLRDSPTVKPNQIEVEGNRCAKQTLPI